HLLQALPTLALSLNSKPEFPEQLKKLGYDTAPWPLKGDLSLTANYDSTAHILRLSELEFNGDAGKVSFKAPVVDMNKFAALADMKPGQQDISALSGALPDFAMDFSVKNSFFAAVFTALREKFPQLQDPGIAGDLALKA